MKLDDLTRSELFKAIAVQMVYLEWLDLHPGSCPDYDAIAWFNIEAKRRFHSDAVFYAKPNVLINEIEFVLINPSTVDDRRKEKSELLHHYASILSGSLVRVTRKQVIEDILDTSYNSHS